jgi:predicted ferric reductase
MANSTLATATKNSTLVMAAYSIHYFIGLGFWLYHKIIHPRLMQKNPYTITEIIQETHNIWTLNCVPENGKILNFKPGQYCYLRIKDINISFEPHPYSFSSSPTQKEYISFTIKELGDYTQKIGQIAVNSKAYVDGPYGIFTPLESKAEEIILIGGGVGFTPLLSMIYYYMDSIPSQKLTFIFRIRTQKDIIKAKEFEEIKKKMPNFSVTPVLSHDESWEGERGFIDQSKLEKYASCEDIVPENQNKDYYICGPPAMIELIIPILKNMGVASQYIHTEQF